jgi:hypothetical protein
MPMVTTIFHTTQSVSENKDMESEEKVSKEVSVVQQTPEQVL